MFGSLFFPQVISLLALFAIIYLFAKKRIKLALILLLIIILSPLFLLFLLNIEKKTVEQDLKSISLKIPAYNKTIVNSNYIKTPIFSFFNDSFQGDEVILSVQASQDTKQEKVVKFYDSWFRENGWRKTVADISSGQHNYVKNNISVHLWWHGMRNWNIEITKR